MLSKRKRFWIALVGLLAIGTVAGLSTRVAGAQGVSEKSVEEEVRKTEEAEAEPATQGSQPWALALAISVAIGVPCLGAGYAVGKVGSAALGAASEKPELLARSLLFVALAEGIAIYGLLIAILLWVKI